MLECVFGSFSRMNGVLNFWKNDHPGGYGTLDVSQLG